MIFCPDCGSDNWWQMHRSAVEPANDRFKCCECKKTFSRYERPKKASNVKKVKMRYTVILKIERVLTVDGETFKSDLVEGREIATFKDAEGALHAYQEMLNEEENDG